MDEANKTVTIAAGGIAGHSNIVYGGPIGFADAGSNIGQLQSKANADYAEREVRKYALEQSLRLRGYAGGDVYDEERVVEVAKVFYDFITSERK
jgi:hypothetical protein